MDLKTQISYKMLCNACLCVTQGLNQITSVKLKQFFLEALNEIPLCNTSDVSPVLCWDCEALLQKAMQFRERVKESYQILLTYSCENINECISARLPRLKVHKIESIDILPGDDEMVKNEVKINCPIKEDSREISDGPNKTQQVYLREQLKLEENRDSIEISEVGPDKTQHVYLREELKLEEDRDADNVDDTFDDNSNHGNTEVIDIIDNIAKKRKRKIKMNEGKRIKKKIKMVKMNKETKHIKTIDLSYEDMMLERESDKTKDNYIQAEYKCEDCILGFNYYKSYKTHLTTKHSKNIGEYLCPVCKTVHANLDTFTSHYKRHMKRYECSICRKRTLDLKVMQQHYHSTHAITLKQYKCADCGKISDSIDTHRYHRESHKARLQCKECDKTFRHRAGLLNHRLAVHEYKNKFPCNICNKVFKWRTSLKRHQYSHENEKPAPAAYCALCGISFKSVCSFQRHMNNSLKHITKDQLRFICDHCNIKFADKTKLRDHIEEKHLHKTFQCNICLRVSKNRVGLDQHIRNVHKGRPNNKMCHHCGKAFPTKVQLESHIRTHTGERPFVCQYCHTTFSQQSNLYKHNRQVHLNMKSKRYPTCKKKETPPELNTNLQPVPEMSVVLHYDNGFLTAEL